MGKTVFQGAGVALVTPMYPDLRINYSCLLYTSNIDISRLFRFECHDLYIDCEGFAR